MRLGLNKRAVSAALVACSLGLAEATAAPIGTTPSGDVDGDGAVTTTDLQCILRTATVLSEFTGSGGALHACDPGACAAGTACRPAPEGGSFCTPGCLSPSALLERSPCVDAPGTCLQGVPARLIDLDCDDRLGSGDFDALNRLLVRTPGDLDGDTVLDLCDPDTDGDGALDGVDCAAFDPSIYPGAVERCDGRFNGCPPGGAVDFPPNYEDPNCAELYGPLVDGIGPNPLWAGVQFIAVGAFFAPGVTVVALDGVTLESAVTSSQQFTAVVPADVSVGSHTLTVTTPQGVIALPVVIAGLPVVTSVFPGLAEAGDTLTITGTELAGTTVTVCGHTAQIVSLDGNQTLTVVVDPFTPLGTCSLVVNSPVGTDSVEVVVAPGPPFVAGVAPNPVLAGEPILLHGANLSTGTVSLNGEALETWLDDDGELRARIPDGLASGPYTLIVTTAGGLDTVVVFVTDVVLGPPILVEVSPMPVLAGAVMTIRGDWLDGAAFSFGATPIVPVSPGNTEVRALVPSAFPAGKTTLFAVTPFGVASLPVTVVGQPTITSLKPASVAAGASLQILGAYLFPFDRVSIGGVDQTLFTQLTATALTVSVSPGTPLGLQEVLVETPVGDVSAPVTITPANPSPPEISDIEPTSARPGEVVTVTGSSLAGTTVSVGGVVHQVLNPGNDLVAAFVLLDTAPPGEQPVVFDKGTYGSDSLPLYVLLGPPRLSEVRVSAVSADGRAAIAFGPGALALGASVDLGGPFGFVSFTADELGQAGVVVTGVAPGATLSVAQGLPGNVSLPVDLTLPSSPPAVLAPQPYLARVETRPDGVEVFGPAPAFGGEGEVVAIAGEAAGFAQAASLHADPSSGIQLFSPGTAAVTVFRKTASGVSAPEEIFAVAYDPPVLPSAPVAGAVCLMGLGGTAANGVTVRAEYGGGSEAPATTPSVSSGPAADLLAVSVVDGPLAVAEVEWTIAGSAGAAVVTTPAGGVLAGVSVQIETAGSVTNVSATGLTNGQWLLVASSSGTVTLTEASAGTASVATTGSGRAFVYSPADDRATACVGF